MSYNKISGICILVLLFMALLGVRLPLIWPSFGQPLATPSDATAAAPLNRSHWTESSERTEHGQEADLVIRIGKIDNLGFGWPDGFDPFTGKSTPVHGWPWKPPGDAPAGLKRIILGSGITEQDVATRGGDGYSHSTQRADTRPEPITVPIGALPDNIESVLIQFFLDDFQAPVFKSHFQVSLNGTRIPAFEQAVNSLDQTGPIGKLVTLRLLPEYYDLLKSGSLQILFDDPLTHVPDGFAVDFVRILINVHSLPYTVALKGSVRDATTRRPIPHALVTAGLSSAKAGQDGSFVLTGIPAGLVIAAASQAGYADTVQAVDLIDGQTGQVDFLLAHPVENAAKLQEDIERTGMATVYGIHFDFDRASLRPDSLKALRAVLTLIKQNAQAHWTVVGHTDSQGTRDHNLTLSQARAQTVVAWLIRNGVPQTQVQPVGSGSDHPVADNSEDSGRALNRRVELQKAM